MLDTRLISAHDRRASRYDAWAAFYDAADADREPFLSFYGSLLTDSTRSILDLGCGTGLITAALANEMKTRGRAGRVIGLDNSAAMLEVARRRSADVEWILGDLRAPVVPGPFELVTCCYNVLQELLRDEDLAQAFASVRRLLSSSGAFAFDIYQPNAAYLNSRPVLDRLARSIRDHNGRNLEIREDTAYDRSSQVLDIRWRLFDVNRRAEPLAQMHYHYRQYSADHIDRLLTAAGLRVLARYGDFQKSPFGPTSKKQILVCAAA